MTDIETFRREHWQLERILFRVRPPEKRYLSEVFTGRTTELEKCRMNVYEAPSNVLVNGVFGVGKTVFIQELLRQLRNWHKDDILTVYETMERGDADLLTTILRGLAKILSDENEEARNIDAVLSGLEVSSMRARKLGGEVEASIPGVITMKAKPEKEGTTTQTTKEIANAAYQIRRLIEGAVERKPDRRLVIAMDDLDKRDPETIRRSLVEARTTLHLESSFILTGHPLGVLRDAFATAGGIFDLQIELTLFSDEELEEMMRNYLTAGRVKRPRISSLLVPFTRDVAEAIIARAYGIPRVLNAICFHILGEAARRRLPTIGLSELQQCWETVVAHLRRGVQPDLRNLLEVLLEYPEGLVPTHVPDEVFLRLGLDSHEELLSKIDEAMRSDWAVSFKNVVIAHPSLTGFSRAGELHDRV